ncbi:hypothetical protein [Cellulomonas sp.]|uniref:hypothetical protein n=1 Tax=Cellulomonas sp. TaxID=40001 RepID=UPI001B0C4E4F|nr:hypothetical protein [Cellulomonas sp.]MBO9556742.1 hypothetical protein [Cellulomonas sp.]
MSTPTIDVPVYLQVEPRDRAWSPEGRGTGPARAAAVVGTTTKRPRAPRPVVVVVKVTLRIPAAAFDPLRPEAVVVIPADLTDPHPVVVDADDATDGGDRG